MREVFEFRIPEKNAAKHLPAGFGDRLGDTVRRVRLSPEDPLLKHLQRIDREFRSNARVFFTGWSIKRVYSNEELARAPLFRARVTTVFEPAGEECGTVYDEASSCNQVVESESVTEVSGHQIRIPPSRCGAGAIQAGPLFLDGRRIPRKVDIARTIAGEIVVSARLRVVFEEVPLSGAQFTEVRLSNRQGVPSKDHFQMRVSTSVDVHPSTRAGDDPFDETSHGRCPLGHVLGLNLLSEVTVERRSLAKVDVMMTRQLVGVRSGLLRPEPLLLVSPNARRSFDEAEVKGLSIEVAHLA